jgi:hypothetical protein
MAFKSSARRSRFRTILLFMLVWGILWTLNLMAVKNRHVVTMPTMTATP